MRVRPLILAALAACWLGAAPARAGLLGDSIAASFRFPDLSTVLDGPVTATVAPTATFDLPAGGVQAVVSDTQIVVTVSPGISAKSFNAAAFNGLRLENLTKPFGSVVLNTVLTTQPDFTPDRIGLSGKVLTLNFQFMGLNDAQAIVLDVLRAPGPVPAPAALGLFGLGLLGLAALRRAPGG